MKVGLVACCGKKLDDAAPASRLYDSQLFKKSVAWLKPRVNTWAILSAKHGLVLPDDVIEPYDMTLNNMRANERASWAFNTGIQLRAKFPAATYVVLAGKRYRAALHGLIYTAPMEGLGIGEQLRFLTNGAST